MQLDAETSGIICVPIEAPEDRSLPAVLLPALRSNLIHFSRQAAAKAWAQKVMGTLAAFAKAFKMKYDDIEFAVDVEPIAGIADSGDLENDLAELIELLGKTAQSQGTVLSLFIDEL